MREGLIRFVFMKKVDWHSAILSLIITEVHFFHVFTSSPPFPSVLSCCPTHQWLVVSRNTVLYIYRSRIWVHTPCGRGLCRAGGVSLCCDGHFWKPCVGLAFPQCNTRAATDRVRNSVSFFFFPLSSFIFLEIITGTSYWGKKNWLAGLFNDNNNINN